MKKIFKKSKFIYFFLSYIFQLKFTSIFFINYPGTISLEIKFNYKYVDFLLFQEPGSYQEDGDWFAVAQSLSDAVPNNQ